MNREEKKKSSTKHWKEQGEIIIYLVCQGTHEISGISLSLELPVEEGRKDTFQISLFFSRPNLLGGAAHTRTKG